MATFGECFKKLRIATGQTLRAFCAQHGYDPGNISKLERSILPPPDSNEKLAEYARALRLKKATDPWFEFFDLAAAERGRIPTDLLKDEELLGKLPVMFRTMRGAKLDRARLDEFVERIRRA